MYDYVAIFLRLLLGICVGYLLVSLAESFLHNHVAHASAAVRRMWKKTKWFYKWFDRPFYSHHVVHHFLTYRVDYVTQFKDKADHAQIDRSILDDYASGIKKERYGLTLRGMGILRFVAPVAPLFVILPLMFGWFTFIGSLLPLAAYPWMSMVVHPWLHRPHAEVDEYAHPIIVALFRTKYMKLVVQNHFMHHKYTDCNFNLLLGGDLLLGVYRRPSHEDLIEMRKLGLLVD